MTDRRWLLSASPAGRAAAESTQTSALTLIAWVRRQIASGWWPLPRRTLDRRPHAKRGERGIVYVGGSFRQIVAQVILDDGPRFADEARTTLGIGILAVEPFTPPVAGELVVPLNQRAGLALVSPEKYNAALSQALGKRPWQVDGIQGEPVIYRQVRYVDLDDGRLSWPTDMPWPRVDRDGRLRFNLLDGWRDDDEESWRLDRDGFRVLEGWHEDHEWSPLERRLKEDEFELRDGEIHELVVAVGADGEEYDITDAALTAAGAAYEAAIGGTFDEEDVERLELHGE